MAKFRGVLSGQFYYQYRRHGDDDWPNIITAHPIDPETGKPREKIIGSMQWATPDLDIEKAFGPEKDEIKWIGVDSEYRGKGIATRMLRLGRSLSRVTNSAEPEKYGLGGMTPIKYPEHSPDLTPEGAAWLEKVEGHEPKMRRCSYCGDATPSSDIKFIDGYPHCPYCQGE